MFKASARKLVMASLVFFCFLGAAVPVLAQLNVGTNDTNVINNIGLGQSDPKVIIARVINFSMAFLGIIAVILIIFAGFKWMSSNGNEEEIENAKKILKAAVIGLVIILSSWGIATFVLNRLVGATGNNGTTTIPGCVGPNCTVPNCTGAGCLGSNCDSNTLMPECQAGSCQTGLICDATSCACRVCNGIECETGGELGANCSTSGNPDVCEPKAELCNQGRGLVCSATSCTCEGSPVITAITPGGGFCVNQLDMGCVSDADCTSGGCDLETPNADLGSFVTISGYNFGALQDDSTVMFGVISSEDKIKDGVAAMDPAEINTACIKSWSDTQIIVAVPYAGNLNGPMGIIVGDKHETTDNNNGPKIKDFVVTATGRPALCALDGLTDNVLSYGNPIYYIGAKMKAAIPYFGSYAQNLRAFDYNLDDLNGNARVPNMASQKVSTFISRDKLRSNILEFYNTGAPEAGPAISTIDPSAGAPGQYLTIRGAGFGNTMGENKIYFVDGDNKKTAASFIFPQVCLQSIWKDNQIIIKVPTIADGVYGLSLIIGDKTINTANNIFTVNSGLVLKPSLCKIDPEKGPALSLVNFYGEYFGTVGTKGWEVFNKSRVINNAVIALDNKDNSHIITGAVVPSEAITGPTYIRRVENGTNIDGNSLNFIVGECTVNNDCSSPSPTCCPLGTPKKGQCAAALFGDNGCFFASLNSVYEWRFSAGLNISCNDDASGLICKYNNQKCLPGTICNNQSCTCVACTGSDCNPNNRPCGSQQNGVCKPNHNDCIAGTSCNAGTCTCIPEISGYSCMTRGRGTDSCPTGGCPNSPGKCSPYTGSKFGNKVGDCNSDCSDLAQCDGIRCQFDENLQLCLAIDQKCELPTTGKDLGVNWDDLETYQKVAVCQAIPGEDKNIGRWVMDTQASCPGDWTRINNNQCVKNNSSCVICDQGLSCVLDQYGGGKCSAGRICPLESKCINKECKATSQDKCECCCDKNNASRDCCAPLTCEGSCGSGATDLGFCGGCANVGSSIAEKDAACNCTGNSGKYCAVSSERPQGYCGDCTALATPSDCANHAANCCWDDKTGVCRGGYGGGAGGVVFLNSFFGHCAYYGCMGDSCASSAPHPYLAGKFTYDLASCASNCQKNPPIVNCGLYNNNLTGCKNAVGCCYNQSDGKCLGGGQKNTLGQCTYYACENRTCSLTTSSVASFTTLNTCNANCLPETPTGEVCKQLIGSVTTCTNAFCVNPFSCIKDPSVSTDCGTCCCNPLDDQCPETLTCEPNKGNCSGNNRGLCCGCRIDKDCGAVMSSGCGLDSCCLPRPQILDSALMPAKNQIDVCRNTQIVIPFNTKMNSQSLLSNIVVLAELPAGSICESGVQIGKVNLWGRIKNILAVWRNSFVDKIANLFNHNSALANLGQNHNHVYCTVDGVVTVENTTINSIAYFAPQKLLAANTNYFVVVAGQETPDENTGGAIDANGIGMIENGYDHTNIFGPFGERNFINSFIYSFKTLASSGNITGICTIDSVDVSPKSYLFSSNLNDANENDNNVNDITFDTKVDRDKLYTAQALSADGQILSRVLEYNWNYNWSVDNNNVATFSNSVGGLNSSDNRGLLSVKPGVVDSRAEVVVELNVLTGKNTGQKKVANEPFTVFVCDNPWPAPITISGYPFWQPFFDDNQNCSSYSYCNSYNYSLYYCRDSGVSGTADDLPAMPEPGKIVSSGTSTRKVCSNDRTQECTGNHECANGYCIYEILKESYFFEGK